MGAQIIYEWKFFHWGNKKTFLFPELLIVMCKRVGVHLLDTDEVIPIVPLFTLFWLQTSIFGVRGGKCVGIVAVKELLRLTMKEGKTTRLTLLSLPSPGTRFLVLTYRRNWRPYRENLKSPELIPQLQFHTPLPLNWRCSTTSRHGRKRKTWR